MIIPVLAGAHPYRAHPGRARAGDILGGAVPDDHHVGGVHAEPAGRRKKRCRVRLAARPAKLVGQDHDVERRLEPQGPELCPLDGGVAIGHDPDRHEAAQLP